ncbi:MAG: hypothetical protein HZC02_03070 [Candidatus Levybacteria bacterium]|nr:hypothetical protein [Candidatus Levybacteria bacterium]
MKKNQLLIAAAVVVLLIVGGVFVFIQNAQDNDEAENSQILEEEAITVSPEEVGLKLTTRNNQKEIKFSVSKLDDVQTIEWDFTYDADVPPEYRSEGGSGKVTQRFGSSEPVDVEGKSSYESEYREIGTCSSGRCRYDTGVEKVDFVLKMIKKDGKEYQVQDSLSLE